MSFGFRLSIKKRLNTYSDRAINTIVLILILISINRKQAATNPALSPRETLQGYSSRKRSGEIQISFRVSGTEPKIRSWQPRLSRFAVRSSSGTSQSPTANLIYLQNSVTDCGGIVRCTWATVTELGSSYTLVIDRRRKRQLQILTATARRSSCYRSYCWCYLAQKYTLPIAAVVTGALSFTADSQIPNLWYNRSCRSTEPSYRSTYRSFELTLSIDFRSKFVGQSRPTQIHQILHPITLQSHNQWCAISDSTTDLGLDTLQNAQSL